MPLSKEETAEVMLLARQYACESPDRILLGKSIIPSHLRPYVARQVALASKWEDKFPSRSEAPFFFPENRVFEQASSEATARHKAQYISSKHYLFDGTGGAGIDFLFMAERARAADYMERDEVTFLAATYNLAALVQKKSSIKLFHSPLQEKLPEIARTEGAFLYCDPARRDAEGKKSFLLQDTVPNPTELVSQLKSLGFAGEMLFKVSPMLDLEAALRALPHTAKAEILSVRGEVKEILLYLLSLAETPMPIETIAIATSDLAPSGDVASHFSFTLGEERAAVCQYTSVLEEYLLLPEAGIMKAGAFKTLAQRFGMMALHPNSHIYTTAAPCGACSLGKCYRIEEVIPFSSRSLKQLSKRFPKADFTTRNFPLTPEELYKRTGIKPGSDCRIIATTLADERRILAVVHLLR